MPITCDIKTDYLYQQGFEQGLKQGFEQGFKQGLEQGMNKKDYENKVAFVESLLLNTDFDLSKIAMITSVSLDFAKEVKQKLDKQA